MCGIAAAYYVFPKQLSSEDLFSHSLKFTPPDAFVLVLHLEFTVHFVLKCKHAMNIKLFLLFVLTLTFCKPKDGQTVLTNVLFWQLYRVKSALNNIDLILISCLLNSMSMHQSQ
jgi:hypothetical protein